MISIRHILCPTDFSEFSARAFRYAVSLAKSYDAGIIALHVHPLMQPPSTKIPTYSVRAGMSPALREQLHLDLKRFVGPARSAGVLAEERLVEGDPVGEILQHSESTATDLLVMGTHGRGGFERLVLGSITEKVLRKARCPVLTVPRAARAPAQDETVEFKQILCPVDFSETSLKALEYALSLAKESEANVVLLHVTEAFPEEQPFQMHTFNVPEYRKLLEDDARERLLKLIPEGARDRCQPEAIVASGKAYRSILEVAEKRRAELIVMGVRGRNPLDLMLFGSTTQHIVRQADCPVLTVRTA